MTTSLNIDKITNKKNTEDLVNTLLAVEKENKKFKINYEFPQLIGCWRLYFVTGTKKVRQKVGVQLGAGKYVPNFIKINLTYTEDLQVENRVKLGFLELSLTGPVKFLKGKNILVFDFTKISFKLWGKTVYSNYFNNGRIKEKTFAQDNIKKQAFFRYFLVEDKLIAARGRGGGLAIWIKE